MRGIVLSSVLVPILWRKRLRMMTLLSEEGGDRPVYRATGKSLNTRGKSKSESLPEKRLSQGHVEVKEKSRGIIRHDIAVDLSDRGFWER